VGFGASWQSILAVADDEHARLIVTDSRGAAHAHAMLGSVSRGLAHHSRIPVLVVPLEISSAPASVFLDET
jgi:nucleotide-binding universal stress UspA family protein